MTTSGLVHAYSAVPTHDYFVQPSPRPTSIFGIERSHIIGTSKHMAAETSLFTGRALVARSFAQADMRCASYSHLGAV